MIAELFGMVQFVLGLHPIIIIGILLVLIVVALKVFKFLLRIVITGVAFALFPIVAYVAGFPVDLSFSAITGSAVFGIIIYFAYSAVRTGFKVLKLVLSPFKRFFRDKPKPVEHKTKTVVIREKAPAEEDKKKEHR